MAGTLHAFRMWCARLMSFLVACKELMQPVSCALTSELVAQDGIILVLQGSTILDGTRI